MDPLVFLYFIFICYGVLWYVYDFLVVHVLYCFLLFYGLGYLLLFFMFYLSLLFYWYMFDFLHYLLLRFTFYIQFFCFLFFLFRSYLLRTPWILWFPFLILTVFSLFCIWLHGFASNCYKSVGFLFSWFFMIFHVFSLFSWILMDLHSFS